ncbi:elongation factor tu gtp binding domain-containing protein, partial [Cystoisospora suis]
MGLPSSFSSSSSSSVDHHMPMPSSTRYERTARIDSSSSSTPQPLRQSSDMRATDKPHRPLSSPVSSSSSSSSVSPGDNKKFPSHQQDLFLAPSSTLSQKETGEAFDKDSCEGEGRRRMEGKSGAKEQRKADKEEEEQEEGSFFMKRSSCGLSHGQLLLQEQLRRESSCFRQGRSISCDEDLLPKAFDQDEKDEKKKKKILDDDEENGSIRCVDVKIAVVGNVDSGKSTLVGVLSSRCLDDGRGLARSRIFNFPHEAATGRTSSLATEIVGFDSHGDQILPPSSSSSHARHSQRHPHLPPPSSSSVLSSLSSSSSLHGEGSSFSRKTTHLHDVSSSSSSSLKEKEKDKKNTSKKEISTRPSSSSLSQKEEDPHGDLPEMSSVRSNTPSDLGRHPLHPSFHHDSHNRNFKHTHPHPEEEEPLLHSKAESHDEKKDPGKEEGEGESISPLLKTSSSSSHSPLPSSSSTSRQVAWRAIVQEAKKIVTFLDLCGHERYLKTTVFGLVATYPDYSMVVISGNSQAGLQRMTKEHLGICLGLNLPFFVVVTKIDLTPPHVYQKTLESICKVLKHPTVKKLPIIVKREEEIGAVTKAIPSGR